MANFYKWTKTKWKLQINDVIEWSVDTGTDVTIIAPEPCHSNWMLQEVNIQLLVIETLSQLKHSLRWVEHIGPGGQRGKLKPYVADIAKNLWGCDLFQQ